MCIKYAAGKKYFFLFIQVLFLYSISVNAQINNPTLKKELDSIRIADQKYRMIADSIGQKNGFESKEYQENLRLMLDADSSNSKRIRKIISLYGWPGKTLVGNDANVTVFLVVQHSDLSMQQFYLPMLKESVFAGESRGRDLAYLEDRVAIKLGRKQVYGTQLTIDKTTGRYYVNSLEDPDGVDERRKKIGLNPIADYLKAGWNIDWNLENFKKEQEERERKNKSGQ